MKSFDFDFLKISPTDVVDIVLVALLIYYVYTLIRNTLAVNLLVGMFVITVFYWIVKGLHMELLTTIIEKFMSVGIIALIVIFHPEIRRFLLLIGKNAFLQKNKAWWGYLFGRKEIERNNLTRIKPIIDACKTMKKTRTGALMVFVKFYDEQFFIKAQRIRTLEEKKVSKVGEGIIPEYIGIINYCVIAMLQLNFTENDALELPVNQVEVLFDGKVKETKDLMFAKNHDYGEAWRDMRISSLTDLILQKIFRVKQIEDNEGATQVSEGVHANYQDMLNYAVFALIKLGVK